MGEQHDDHCWIRFHGVDRKIIQMNSDRWIKTMTRTGATAILDLSNVDWGRYIPAWEALQDELFPWWRAR